MTLSQPLLIEPGKQDVEIIAQKPLYRGFFSLTEYRFRHRKFDGTMSGEVVREIFERGHAAALLAYDPNRDAIVLVEQIRIGAWETSKTPWLFELVAGMIEPDEDIEAVVRREAVEEAGVNIGRCKPIMSYLSSPGGSTERVSILVGEVDSTTASGVHGLWDEHEDIRVCVVTRQQAYQWVEEGKIDNAFTIIAIQWLQLHYQNLQKEWQTSL